MSRDEALAELHRIVAGIDRTESEADGGWWETSTGASFGASTLRLLEAFVCRLTEEQP